MGTFCAVCDEPVEPYEDFVGEFVGWNMGPGTEEIQPEPPVLQVTHLYCWTQNEEEVLDDSA